MADPTGPFEWRPRDGDNDILRKILNWFAALGAGTKSIAVNISSAVGITGFGFSSEDTSTRPNNTTPYTALDVVGTDPATNMTFAGIGPAAGGKVIITHASLRVDVASVPAGMTQFRLHLLNAAPTAITDNMAFNLIAADRDKYLGFIEIPTPLDLGDTLFNGTEEGYYPVRKEVVVPVGGTLYGVLQTVGGFTPTAQSVTVVSLKSVSV
jgi:hypothetical protein